ncbi:MAG: restriction endonuclease subunit S [Sideroxydans sp.]|nr:restriction endonuclease subunit S [Sideroxydans sp.]
MSGWQETEVGPIPIEWSLTTVGQLVEEGVIDKPLDGNHGEIHPKGSDFVSEGIPFVMATDINDGKVDLKGCKFITKEQADSLNKGFSNRDDVLLTHKATLGRTAIVGDIKTPYIMLTPQVTYYRVINNKRLSNKFLKYYFDSPVFQDTLVNHGDSGSTRAYVGITAQRELPVILPNDITEQKTIAAVLSSLDDKIDLLHRQNKTLEAMATSLFRQWFVEEAQVDWEERPLSSIANFLNGLACQKYPPKNELKKLPVLKIKELSGGISEASDWATSEVKPEYIVEAGDVIFAWSASLMVKVWDGERCVLNQHLFKVTSDEFPKWFYLMWCKHHLAEFIAISASHATTMGHIKRGDLDAAMVSVPSPDRLKAMSEQMMPLLDKQIEIAKQRRTLEALRDSLLPKLMSGEVRVAF